ncbi:hypothetical protein HELRODRAFT_160061 [Helobdella robusta]|uniref:WSC domain-containing protein n=1 Tax=Helobdella robusta TaxID=6412 RepID=T1EPQ6_HELRO|nr:hypothetical protein HELRODRAFT_160061 [Helobdella robusta]ESO05961.1 hypothetical protein HELRODRAFT_160061 [Helobdella robusta]
MSSITCLIIFVTINLSSVAHTAIDLKESYIGCYRNISSTKIVAIVGSVGECSLECKDESNNMIALKYGEECNCIERLDSAVASSLCDVPCDNGDACGGSDSYSVYKSKPRVMHDAYASIESREMTSIEMNLPDGYTLETCAYFCLETNHTFFQQIMNQKCECFQHHSMYKRGFIPKFVSCQKCSHIETQICDCFNNVTDETLIFATRFQYDFQRGMSTYSHCNNRKYKIYEITKCSDGCEYGWKGDWCRERNCKVGNGGCGSEMSCTQLTVNKYKYVECVCPLDTVRNKWNKCEVMRTNLALNKPSYCSSKYSHHDDFKYDPSYLTDGMYDGHHLSHIDFDESAWLAVDLFHSYPVGFVRAYNRWGSEPFVVQRMDKFAVRLNETFDLTSIADIRNQTNFCGYGPERALGCGNPMVVICEDFRLLSRFVIIQQSDDKFGNSTTALAELEVYEAGCDLFNGRCENEICKEVTERNRKTICCGCLVTTTLTIVGNPNETFRKNEVISTSYDYFWYFLAGSLVLVFLTTLMIELVIRKKMINAGKDDQKTEENDEKREEHEDVQSDAGSLD